MELANAFRAERLKMKKTAALRLTVIGAFFMPLMVAIAYISSPENFYAKPVLNPWDYLFGLCYGLVSPVFIPLFIVLLTAFVLNVEHKSNTWKHIFVQPLSRGSIFLAKLGIIIQKIILCYVLFVGFLLLLGTIMGLWKSEFGFLSAAPSWMKILKFTTASFISTLALVAIHFWLMFRVKNVILPIVIGLVGVVAAGILANRWDYIEFFPYAYPLLSLKGMVGNYFKDFHLISAGYFLLITFLAYVDFRKIFRG